MVIHNVKTFQHRLLVGDRTFYITHIKPIFGREIVWQFVLSGRANIRILKQFETLTIKICNFMFLGQYPLPTG